MKLHATRATEREHKGDSETIDHPMLVGVHELSAFSTGKEPRLIWCRERITDAVGTTTPALDA